MIVVFLRPPLSVGPLANDMVVPLLISVRKACFYPMISCRAISPWKWSIFLKLPFFIPILQFSNPISCGRSTLQRFFVN